MLAKSSTVSIIFPPDLATTFRGIVLENIRSLVNPSFGVVCLLTCDRDAGTKASTVVDDAGNTDGTTTAERYRHTIK